MALNINSQIEEAREFFNKAFRTNEISARNKFLDEGLDKFKEIEILDIDVKQKQKISNIKIAYSIDLLKSLRPTPSVDNDFVTFTILIRLNSDLNSLFKKFPELEKKLIEFRESLNRSPKFRRFISSLEK